MVLAVGWAGYLIPKALKHHDDLAMSRPVDTFSDSVRVVGAPVARAAVKTTVTTTATTTTTDVVEASVETPVEAPVAVPIAAPAVRPRTITRESARNAARRRRRVLVVLLLALVAVAATSYLAYTPWLTTAIPGGLIVAFLVVARLTVRAQQVRRAAPVQQSAPEATAQAAAKVVEPVVAAPVGVEADLGREDTQGFSREQLAEAVAVPVLDEGALWDPLPVTLPTYVNKARARRTVRTIEITGITSSGHDAADTQLAREAEDAAAALEAEMAVEAEIAAEQRKAAGA